MRVTTVTTDGMRLCSQSWVCCWQRIGPREKSSNGILLEWDLIYNSHAKKKKKIGSENVPITIFQPYRYTDIQCNVYEVDGMLILIKLFATLKIIRSSDCCWHVFQRAAYSSVDLRKTLVTKFYVTRLLLSTLRKMKRFTGPSMLFSFNLQFLIRVQKLRDRGFEKMLLACQRRWSAISEQNDWFLKVDVWRSNRNIYPSGREAALIKHYREWITSF